MYDENKIVQIKWNNNNIEWFESKGYVFTKRYDLFDVLVKDLNPTSKQRIIAICDYCGNEYETSYAVLLNGRKVIRKDCCPHCTGKKTSEVSKKKRAIRYIGLADNICKENGYTLLTRIDDYTDIKMDIEFVCPVHGKQRMVFDNFIHGHKCKDCSYEYRGENLRYDIEYVKEYIESINGNKLLNPEDYEGVYVRNLNIRCSCGKVYTTSFGNYKYANVTTCLSCSCKMSNGEKRIKDFLEFNKVNFVQEKRFEDCRDVKPLPFDFYLPELNLIIEYDGEQHFGKVYNRDYETTKKHDEIKNQYCKDNNIYLLRIPYWKENNIEDIITTKLNL